MTKNQRAVSWGLTGFFGVICLGAAPQLSIGLLIKYGMMSTALGFGITAISNAVGELFPDNNSRYTRNDSIGSSSGYHYHEDPSPSVIILNNNPQPRSFWSPFFSTGYSSVPQNSSHGTFLSRTTEPVNSSVPPITQQKPATTHLNRRVEPVAPPASNNSSWLPSFNSSSNTNANAKPAATLLNRRTESLTPSAPPAIWFSGGDNSKPTPTFLGSRREAL